MTVSLALRNSREVSAATRQRIQRLARDKGYRPDPAVTKLMHHLRLRAPRRSTVSICALGSLSPLPQQWGIYVSQLVEGMRWRAEDSGYAFSMINLEEYDSSAILRRVLRSRGVDGLAILPLPQMTDFTGLLEWDDFSVVAATSTVVGPRFHRVLPNHFENMLSACRALSAAGFRRIGLAISSDFDRRVQHQWTAGIGWYHAFGGAEAVRTFIGEPRVAELKVGALAQWLRREKPDAVISDISQKGPLDAAVARVALRRPLELFHMSWPEPWGEPGIDQCPRQLGAVAVDVLAGMLTRGEKGIPAWPRTVTTDGRWRPGTTDSNLVRTMTEKLA